MNNEAINNFVSNVQLPSDFLLDNYKSITRRADTDEMFEGLDSLFEDAIA